MNKNDVEILDRQTAYEGFYRLDRYRLRHRLHRGGWSRAVTRENFDRGHAVAVLPYDPEADAVVVMEQFRIGAMAAGLEPWIVEIVAGMIDPGEDTETVARRETREEVGRDVGDLIRVCDFLSTPGGCSETVTVYCGRIDSAGIEGVHGNPEEDEDILVYAIGFEEAMQRVADGRINNGMTIIALQWLALHREEVRGRWLPQPSA